MEEDFFPNRSYIQKDFNSIKTAYDHFIKSLQNLLELEDIVDELLTVENQQFNKEDLKTVVDPVRNKYKELKKLKKELDKAQIMYPGYDISNVIKNRWIELSKEFELNRLRFFRVRNAILQERTNYPISKNPPSEPPTSRRNEPISPKLGKKEI